MKGFTNRKLVNSPDKNLPAQFKYENHRPLYLLSTPTLFRIIPSDLLIDLTECVVKWN